MKITVAVVLLVVGGGIMGWGVLRGVSAIGTLYRGTLEHPLDQPDGFELAQRDSMLNGVKVGAIGAPPFIIGSVMLKREVRRRLLASQRDLRR